MKTTHALSTFILFLIFSLQAISAPLSFDKKKLQIGNQILTVEIADTPDRSSQGLMFRKELKEGNGMLFVFPDESIRSFWMKNTFVPLSIGYFNAKNELIDIQDMQPAESEMQTQFPTYVSKGPAKYALEVPKGWFVKHKIALKQKFKLL